MMEKSALISFSHHKKMNKWNVANYITFHSSRDSLAVDRSISGIATQYQQLLHDRLAFSLY